MGWTQVPKVWAYLMKLLLIYPGGIRVMYKGFNMFEMLEITHNSNGYDYYETIGWVTPEGFC